MTFKTIIFTIFGLAILVFLPLSNACTAETLVSVQPPNLEDMTKTLGYNLAPTILPKDFEFDKNALIKFNNQKEVVVERLNKKGRTTKINLKNVVKNIIFTSNKEVEFILKPDNEKIVRPFEVLKKIFNFPDEENKQARVVKIKNRQG